MKITLRGTAYANKNHLWLDTHTFSCDPIEDQILKALGNSIGIYYEFNKDILRALRDTKIDCTIVLEFSDGAEVEYD